MNSMSPKYSFGKPANFGNGFQVIPPLLEYDNAASQLPVRSHPFILSTSMIFKGEEVTVNTCGSLAA
jgi:hypothetical protein